MRVACFCVLVVALSCKAVHLEVHAAVAATDSSSAVDDASLEVPPPSSTSTEFPVMTPTTTNSPPTRTTPAPTSTQPPSSTTNPPSTPTPTRTQPLTTGPPVSAPLPLPRPPVPPTPPPLPTPPPTSPTTRPPITTPPQTSPSTPPTTRVPTSLPPTLSPPPTDTNSSAVTTTPPATDTLILVGVSIPTQPPGRSPDRRDADPLASISDLSPTKANSPPAKADAPATGSVEATAQQAIESPTTTTQESTQRPTEEPVDTYRRDLNTTWTRRPQSGSRDNDELQVPRVVGGREDRNTAANETIFQDSDITTQTASVSRIYHVFKYLVSLSAVGSMLLLLFFHSLAVDDRFDWSSLSISPNAWEFLVYVSYVQHLLSISQMALVKTPYSLWTMLDALSWTGFLPYHSSTSAITVGDQGAPRRLDTILLSGLVAFADRVGVRETDLLVRSSTNLVIFLGGLLVLFFTFAAVAKRQMDHRDSLPSDYTAEDDARVALWRKISMQVCGLLVLLWLFALYPLSAVASYEVSMEVRASTYATGPLVLVVITLPVLCLGGLVSLAYQIIAKTEYELHEPFRFILWGGLYADCSYDKRAFLVAHVLLQIASGVIVGSVRSGSTQASVLIALYAAFVLAALMIKPFISGSVAPWFVVVLSLVKITNLSLALSAFTATSSLSANTRASVADTIIYLNALLVFCWFMRHALMLMQAVKCLRGGSAKRLDDFGFHSQHGDVEEQPTRFQYAESDTYTADSAAFSQMSSYK